MRQTCKKNWYFIKAKKGIISYKIVLPKDIKVKFIFYILFLELPKLKILI